MIITLNNDSGLNSVLLKLFDCSWISRYPDEDERLFINGSSPTRVASVRIMKTNKNYYDLFDGLYLFDAMLSGSLVNPFFVKKNARRKPMEMLDNLLMSAGIMIPNKMNTFKQNNVTSFNELIESGYSESEAAKAIMVSKGDDTSSDSYINSMFNAYVAQKKYISISIISANMINYYTSEFCGFVSVIIEGSKILQHKRIDLIGGQISSRVNLLASSIFTLLPNAKFITIETGCGFDEEVFAFNIFYFLENISIASKWRRIMIQRTNSQVMADWIAALWKSSSTNIINAYKKKNLIIEFDTEFGGEFYREYLIIKRSKQ